MQGDTIDQQLRDVILGRHSAVWRALQEHPSMAQRNLCALGHRELSSFVFKPGDRVWVLSYSPHASQNSDMLMQLSASPASEIIYVGSSSTIVCGMTDCYAYPRIKRQAECEALGLTKSRLLTLGLVFEQPEQLPGGLNMATSLDQLAAFISNPQWPENGGRSKCLLTAIQRPFGSAIEAWVYRYYGRWLQFAGRWPCILRPIDLVLRALGWRWYGYVFLSNRLWTATI